MSRLYDIAERYNNLKELLDNDEVTPDMISGAINEIEGEFQNKVDGICKFMLSLEGDIALIEEEELRLEARRKKLEDKYSALRDYMKANFNTTGIKKVQTPLFTVTMNSGRDIARITDTNKIPERFIKQKVTTSIDKTSLLKALKDGEQIEGATIGKSESFLKIR